MPDPGGAPPGLRGNEMLLNGLFEDPLQEGLVGVPTFSEYVI